MHPALDHIVLLVPHETLEDLPTWITENFTILKGGKHADGSTENKLVVFQDGTYIELIAFVDNLDPNKRSQHRWGRRSEGHIVDWALSFISNDGEQGDPEVAFQKVQEGVRDAQTGVEYEDPVAGGRTTPAGRVLKWATSSPVVVDKDKKFEDQRISGGELPFWCLDRTPRSWRVPHADPANVTHPSEVVGIAGVTVRFKGECWLGKLGRVYDAIQGYANVDPGSGLLNEWQFQVPVSSDGRGWTLRLEAIDCLQADQHSRNVSVHLKLYTNGEARKISGSIVDGCKLEFDLTSKYSDGDHKNVVLA